MEEQLSAIARFNQRIAEADPALYQRFLKEKRSPTALSVWVHLLRLGSMEKLGRFYRKNAGNCVSWAKRAISCEEPSTAHYACVALRRLASLGIKGAAQAMPRCLDHDDPHVRYHAALSMGILGDPGHMSALARASRDSSAIVRSAAVWGLGKLGGRQARLRVMACFQDRNYLVRARAALAARNMGSREAISALLASLGDREWRVRVASLDALGELVSEEEDAISSLFKMVHDPEEAIRWRTAFVLRQLRAFPRLRLADLEDSGRSQRMSANRIRRMMLGNDAETFLQVLWPGSWSVEEDIDTRCRMETFLGMDETPRLPETWLDALRRFENPISRVWAVEEIGRSRSPDAEGILSHLLTHAEANVRKAALDALARTGSALIRKRAKDFLRDPDERVRAAGLIALMRTGARGAMPRIWRLIGDSRPVVRYYAVAAGAALSGDIARATRSAMDDSFRQTSLLARALANGQEAP